MAFIYNFEREMAILTLRLPKSISPNDRLSIIRVPAPLSSLPVLSILNHRSASVLRPCSVIAPSVSLLSAVSEASVLPSRIFIRTAALASGKRRAVLSSGWSISGNEATNAMSVFALSEESARSILLISNPKPSIMCCIGLPFESAMFALSSGIR